MTMPKFAIFLVPSLAWAAFSASPAHAQTASDPAAARALFGEARQLASQRKYDQACPKFEESLRLDYGIGTLFNLADCWEHLGRTASAWARFLDASAGAKASGQTDREKVARERAAALEPKLARLTIDVKKPEAGLEIKRDAQPIGRAAWGTAVPIDPGVHVIEATATGKKGWTTRVEIPAKAGTVTVAVAPLEDAAEPSQAVALAPPLSAVGASGSEPGPSQTTESSDASEGSWNTQKTIGVSLAGAGVVGLVVGAVFSLTAKSRNDSALSVCADNPSACSQADIARHGSLVSDAQSARTVGYLGLGIGGAALVSGAAVFFTAPKQRAAVTVHPLVADGAVGATIAGRW